METMQSHQPEEESFDENQSIQVIKEMIRISQKKLKNDGILFIVWGWVMFLGYLLMYFNHQMVMTYSMRLVTRWTGNLLLLAGFIFTAYYILKQRKRVQTYIGISLRYVWISMIFCMMLINMIQYNVMHQINFELQLPIFMALAAFAIVATGGILRYRLLSLGGILFGLLAYLSSYLTLPYQILTEAFAWLIAFIIPGHVMYSNRKK